MPLALIAALGTVGCHPAARITASGPQHHLPLSFQPKKPVQLHIDRVSGEGSRPIGEYFYADTWTPAADGGPVPLEYRIEAFCESSLAPGDPRYSQTMTSLELDVVIASAPQIDISEFASPGNRACRDKHHAVSVGDARIVIQTVTDHLEKQQF